MHFLSFFWLALAVSGAVGFSTGPIYIPGTYSNAGYLRRRGLLREGHGADLAPVNGQPVIEDGKPTGARPGPIVRHAFQ